MAQSANRSPRLCAGLACLVLLSLAIAMATPARAGGNEFDDGFQDQLGRLVATEAFMLGKWFLTSAVRHAHSPYPVAYDDAPYDPRDYGDYADNYGDYGDYGDEHGNYGNYAGRDYAAPCDLEYRERVRRDRYGQVVEYERREVCRRRDYPD